MLTNQAFDQSRDNRILERVETIINKAENHVLAIPFDTISRAAVARLFVDIKLEVVRLRAG